MLRRRTKPNGSIKHKIAFDHTSISSPFTSPKLFRASSPRSSSPEYSDTAMSPTSILQTMPLSPTACSISSSIPFFHIKNSSDQTKHHPWDTEPVGLGLVDALDGDDTGKNGSNANTGTTVVIGSKLRIQINEPCSPSSSVDRSPRQTVEFGVKNKSTTPQFADMVPFSPRRCLSPREMELLEDYTCVIAHGPNPRTTHIFDNCVVESCGFSTDQPGRGPGDFLRSCHACNKDLGPGKDIFMYRGERAFCSRECRYQEMLFDEGMEEC